MRKSRKEQQFQPKLDFENKYTCAGYKNICGCDEAGRGPLAGPVVCASCIMPLNDIVEGVDDSKKLSEKKRKLLFEEIKNKAIAYNIVFIDEKTIDEINILNATKKGMQQAINGLSIKPDFALIDAVKGLDLVCECEPIIKGDALSYSIGCASILAKVARDEFMQQLDIKYPDYGFAVHKGYGTKKHMEKLFDIGPCDAHRRTFLKFLENKWATMLVFGRREKVLLFNF